eukprot:664609-Amphidinium_carterae.1
MTDSYAEDETIGKDIMQKFFTKQRLLGKQSGHRLWVNNKETRITPPNLDKEQSDKLVDLTVKDEAIDIPPPPGLALPMPMDIDIAAPQPELPVQGGDTVVDVDNADIAQGEQPAWPTHRLT